MALLNNNPNIDKLFVNGKALLHSAAESFRLSEYVNI